jgi:hypothetical protein
MKLWKIVKDTPDIYQTLWCDAAESVFLLCSSSTLLGEVNEVMCFRSNAEGVFNGSGKIDVRYPASRDNDVHRDLANHCMAEILGWNKPTFQNTESGDSE